VTWNVAPYFCVRDVVASANFYRDQLGFTYKRFWGDPPAFAMVTRSGIWIMLSQFETSATNPNANHDPESQAWDAYIWVDSADDLEKEFRSRGVEIARALEDQPYECRDFEVLDRDGYRLCFGHTTTER